MKISFALAIIATVAQGLLVIAAPSKGKLRSGPPPIPPKVNYDKYYEAIMRANNLTAADVTPMAFGYGAERVKDQISIHAAPHSPTKIHCVGVARNPLRTYIFSDVHGCNVNGWTQSYSFVSLMHESPTSTQAWAACPAKMWGVGIVFADHCGSGSSGAAAVGYANNRNTHHESSLFQSGDGYMHMLHMRTPDFTNDGRTYSYYGSIRHVGILHVPSQAHVDFIARHANEFPSLYKPPAINRARFSLRDGRVIQMAINNIGDLTLRNNDRARNLPILAGFGLDLTVHNDQIYAGRVEFRVTAPVREADGGLRHRINIYLRQPNNGAWQWVGAVNIPTDRIIAGRLVRTALSEAARDHTVVRVEQFPTLEYLVMPLPPTIPLPGIPLLYLGGYGSI